MFHNSLFFHDFYTVLYLRILNVLLFMISFLNVKSFAVVLVFISVLFMVLVLGLYKKRRHSQKPSWGVSPRGWLTSSGFRARLETMSSVISLTRAYLSTVSTCEQSLRSLHLLYRIRVEGTEGSTSMVASALVSQVINPRWLAPGPH